jgi:hypothetical protein
MQGIYKCISKTMFLGYTRIVLQLICAYNL